MHLRVIDLDGSVVAQSGLIEKHAPEIVDRREAGPSVRITCGFGAFQRFSTQLRETLGFSPPGALTFLGSGDFHHVTLALLHTLREPFNLLVIDKHPDWMRRVPVMHCGTWLHHALKLPGLRRVFHIGGDLDFDNWYRYLAPWSELRSGRVTVIPASRRYQSGRWSRLPHRPLCAPGDASGVADILDHALAPFAADLQRLPLYISLDKDCMNARDAVVNWDSGTLSREDVGAILTWFRRAADGRLAGMDVVGDWSRVRLKPGLRTLCHWMEHPRLSVDPREAARVNQWFNDWLIFQMQAWGQRPSLMRERVAA